MAFTKQRFLISPVADADNITASSQGAGTIRTAKKTGTGTSNMTPTGSYTGATNLLFTVQCDGAGTIDSTATIRWKTSDTAAGSWEDTGVSATTTAMSLSNGVETIFDAGTLVLNDKFQFPVYAEFGPGNLFSYDRDDYWKSGALSDYTELITNGGFDSATTSWTAINSTLASVAGGQSGNCLEITRTGGADQTAYQLFTLVIGVAYHVRAWVKSGSSGDEAFRIYDSSGGVVFDFTGTSSSTWTQYQASFIAAATSNYIYLQKKTATAGTMLFDTVSVQQVPCLSIDAGSAEDITAIAVTDHNLSSDAVLTVKMNTSDAWITPDYSDTLDITDPAVEYIDETDRYIKVFFADIDNTDGFISVGKLYIGTYTEVYSGELRGGTNWDTPRPRNRIEISNESIAGKERFYVYSEREEFPLNWTWMSLTALATLRTIWDAFGLTSTGVKPFYFLHYWTDDESTLFFCTCVSSWNPNYHRGGHELSLMFHEDVMTREI